MTWTECEYPGCSCLAKENKDYCLAHKPQEICKHFRIKRKRIDVPYCLLKEAEILGLSGMWHCHDCKDKDLEIRHGYKEVFKLVSEQNKSEVQEDSA